MSIFSNIGDFVYDKWEARHNEEYARLCKEVGEDAAECGWSILQNSKFISDWRDAAEIDFYGDEEHVLENLMEYENSCDTYYSGVGFETESVTCLDVALYVRQFFTDEWLKENDINERIKKWNTASWFSKHTVTDAMSPSVFEHDFNVYVLNIEKMIDYDTLEALIKENHPSVDCRIKEDAEFKNLGAPAKVMLVVGDFACLYDYDKTMKTIEHFYKRLTN